MKRTPQTASSKWRISAVLLALGMSSVATTLTQAQWKGTDVGAPNYKGSVQVDVPNAGQITIKGGGNDIWNASDNFYYYYTPVAGDFDAKVNVESILPSSNFGGNGWAKAELMVRVPSVAGGAPQGNDPFIAMMQNPDANSQANPVGQQFRQTRGAGAADDGSNGGNQPLPTWLRLQRAGGTYTLYFSLNGTDWTQRWSVNTVTTSGWDDGFKAGTSVLLGLAVTAHQDGDPAGTTNYNQAVFSGVSGVVPDLGPYAGATGYAAGFNVSVSDGSTKVVSAITKVTLDDTNVVTGSMTFPPKNGTTSVGYYSVPGTQYFTAGSTHSVKIDMTVNGVADTRTVFFTVANYITVPASYALSGTPSGFPGITVLGYQIAGTEMGTTIAGAEQAWARGIIDPKTKAPYDNLAFDLDFDIDPAGTPDSTGSAGFNPLPFININGAMSSDWPTAAEKGVEIGSFTTKTTPGQTDWIIPGLPGDGTTNKFDNTVYQFNAVIDLTAGFHRMVVNSDDGFKLSVGKGTNDIEGFVLDSFDGGKGASDETSDFVVTQAGKYAVRLLWYQGGGGANCEWFTVNPKTGLRSLVRGTKDSDEAAVGAWSTIAGVGTKAHVTKALPANGWNRADTNLTVNIELADGAGAGATTVIRSELYFDGSAAPVATGVKSINYTHPVALIPNTRHTNVLVWVESGTPQVTYTNTFVFGTRPWALGDIAGRPGLFVIEHEDFNYGKGKSVATASVMPYLGGAYATNTLGNTSAEAAVRGVDFELIGDQGDNGSRYVYRTNYVSDAGVLGIGPSLKEEFSNNYMDDERPGTLGMPGVDANGIYKVTKSYAIGWGDQHWFNYTRTVPAGTYTAFSAVSHGDANRRMEAEFHKVTAGKDTLTQTTSRIGRFRGNGPTPGGWSVWALIPLIDEQGGTTAFKHKGGEVTLRYTQAAGTGDMNFIVLMPVPNAPPQYTGATPRNLLLPIERNQTITWTVEEFSNPLNLNAIVLKINGTNVTPTAVVPDAANQTVAISYAPTALYDIGKQYTWSLDFQDTGGLKGKASGTFMANIFPSTPAGTFVIEAEDFNFGGGQTLAGASATGYDGGIYSLITPVAVKGIDYEGDAVTRTPDANNPAPFEGWNYRTNMAVPVPMNGRTFNGAYDHNLLRAKYAAGDYRMETNHAIGWGGNTRWYNYTRNIPNRLYQIWGGFSHGDQPQNNATGLQGTVYTLPDATITNQAPVRIGQFNSPATGGWGDTVLVPMWDDIANKAAAKELTLGTGATPMSLRVQCGNGDFDYIVLVPMDAAPADPLITGATYNGTTLTITFENGTLEATEVLPATANDWKPVPGASPVTITPDQAKKGVYYRVKGN